MNSAPHLLNEDRPEFERVLEETLRNTHAHPQLAAIGQRLNAEQLRQMALNAVVPIAACAGAEYRRFVELREELRRPANAPSASGSAGAGPSGSSGPSGPSAPGGPSGQGVTPAGALQTGGLTGAMSGGLTEATGAGLMAIVSVLAPLLAGAAALIFLLVGYVLHLFTPEPAIAEPMRNAGWAFAALGAAGALIAMTGLLFTALRNGSRTVPEAERAGPHGPGTLSDEVAGARAAWREALLERGILPFLCEALADPQGVKESPASYVPEVRDAYRPADDHRTPRLGYSHPDFSSHSGEEPARDASRPRFSSPDYSSPDYGGPEHQPD